MLLLVSKADSGSCCWLSVAFLTILLLADNSPCSHALLSESSSSLAGRRRYPTRHSFKRFPSLSPPQQQNALVVLLQASSSSSSSEDKNDNNKDEELLETKAATDLDTEKDALQDTAMAATEQPQQQSDDASSSSSYPLNVPSPLLLASSMLLAIASVGSLFDLLGSGTATTTTSPLVALGLVIGGLPLSIFLLYAAIQKGAAETEEDDARYLGGN